MIPLLKDLNFLSSERIPTERYRQYLDTSRSSQVLGQAVYDAYSDIFTITKNPTKKAEGRRKTALADSWLEGAKDENLEYVDFGDLFQIIIANWDSFKEIIPSQSWLNQRMIELEKARNFVAHNRMLLPNEFQRLYMYISDWNKTVGI